MFSVDSNTGSNPEGQFPVLRLSGRFSDPGNCETRVIPYPVLSGGHDVMHLLPPWLFYAKVQPEPGMFSVVNEIIVNGLSCGLIGIEPHWRDNRIAQKHLSIQEILLYHIREEVDNACKSNNTSFPTQSEICSLLLIGCIAYRIGTLLDSTRVIDAYSELAAFQLDPCGLYKDSKFLLLFRACS